MKRNFLKAVVLSVVLFLPLQAGAGLLDPLENIYWTDEPGISGGVFSDNGQHQYEEELCSVPDNLSDLQQQVAPIASGKPVIAIIIDDMGLDRRRSARAVKLPPQVTLAYLPYSPHIAAQAKAAKEAGHELIVHMPMEPERGTANPGPNVLDPSLSPLELHERIVRNLSAFDGFVGVNNHMGSAFTQNRDGLSVLMTELKARKLVFLDSKTAPQSVAEDVAREAGIAVTHRDVFIDHFEDAVRVEKALAQIERVSKATGSAVAIGHPKDVTLKALEKWLPTVEAKGFRLVPLTEAIRLRGLPPKPRDATSVAKNEQATAPVAKTQ